MTIRARVRQWLGLDNDLHVILCAIVQLTSNVTEVRKLVISSGEWASQNGLNISGEIATVYRQLEHLTALIEPKTQVLNRQPSRVLSFEAEQFENLANIITEEQANGVHR